LNPRLQLISGDLCYADSSGQGGVGDVYDARLWDRWLGQNETVASRVPFMCAVGNHEMEPGFGVHGYAGVLARAPIGGSSPITVPVASTYRVGNVAFIALDSNDVSYEIPANRKWTAGAQTTWLNTTLAGYRSAGSGVDFIVAYMHAAPYSTSSAHASEGGIREAWVPLFDRYQVDLVISGHNHCYERTRPLRAGLAVGSGLGSLDGRSGTTYITAGGGGQASYEKFIPDARTRVFTAAGLQVESAPWSLPSTRTATHAVVCADVTPATKIGQSTTLRVRAVAAGNVVLDEITIVRPATVAQGSPKAAGWIDTKVAVGAGAGTAMLGATGAGLVVARRRAKVV
jgi:hypothetical protein